MNDDSGLVAEADLVSAVQAGDHEAFAAFAALLAAHLPHLRTFLALKAPVPQLGGRTGA